MSETSLLKIKHIPQSVKQKEVMANEAFNILDQAIANVGTHALIQTFGNTVQETSTWTAGSADRKVAQKTTISAAGDMTDIRVSFNGAQTGNAKGILYTIDVNGDPDAYIDSTNVLVNPVDGYNTLTFATPVSVTLGEYAIGIIADYNFALDRASSGEDIWWNDDTYADGAADPWGTLNFQDEKLSIYCTVELLLSDVWTMTDAQMRDAMHIITGALTANTELVVPSRTKLYTIFNNTTGAFDLDVKTAAGNGTQITQGSTVQLYCDGADVYPITNTGGTKL